MAKNNEAKIKFTAETGEFNKQIKDSESTLKELRSELKLNSAEMKGAGDNAETLKKRQEILAKELEESKKKTDALNDKLEAAKKIFGENSEEAKKLQTQLNNAKTAEQNIQNEIDDTNKKLKDQKTRLDEVGESASKVGDKLTAAGKGMSVVSAGIVAAGAGSIAAFNEVDEGADNAIKATGATGEAAAKMEESYKKVASRITGDFADIGSALGEVNTRFGYTGGNLEKATEKFIEFSQITGMDATTAVQSVSRALNDAGIPLSDYDKLLDQLAKAGQTAGIDVTTLTDSLSENGSIMRAMGFNTEETIALLSQFELSGANSSVMLTGMKKAMATWAEEGKNGNKEFAATVEGIKNGSISASDAIDIFGTKAGPMLVDAIKSGKFEYQDMLKTIQSSKGTVEGTFDATIDGGYETELALQNAKLAAAEMGNSLLISLTPTIEKATSALKSFSSWWTGLDQKTQNVILTIAGFVATIGPVLLIAGQFAKSITAISKAVTLLKNSQTLAAIATKVQAAAQWLLNSSILACPITWIIAGIVALVAIFVVLWKKCEGFRNFWKGMWEGIKNAGSKAWEGIKSTFSNIGGWFKEKFTAAKNSIMNIWKSIKLKLPDIKLPHFKINGKFSLNPPSIPKISVDWYAKGGIMTKPTIFGMNGSRFMGGGEAGPEAILPIDRLQGYITNAIDKTMQTANMGSLVNAIESLANRPIEMNINGRQFAQATAADTDNIGGLRNTFTSRGLILD